MHWHTERRPVWQDRVLSVVADVSGQHNDSTFRFLRRTPMTGEVPLRSHKFPQHTDKPSTNSHHLRHPKIRHRVHKSHFLSLLCRNQIQSQPSLRSIYISSSHITKMFGVLWQKFCMQFSLFISSMRATHQIKKNEVGWARSTYG